MKPGSNFNLRLVVSEGGILKLGYLHKLYKTGKSMTWKDVPANLRKQLAKRLGVQP